MPSLGLGLGFARGSSFNPSSLFTSGSRGFFYDFSDYSTMFGDTAGTTAITGVGQSLGLVLDKSAGLALGSELVTNGDFSGGSTGWAFSATAPATVSFSGGVFTFSSPAGEAAFAQQTVLTIGRFYRVTIVVTAVTGAGLRVQAGSGALGAGQFTITSPGTYSPLLLCNGTDGNLLITRAGAGSGTVDSISAREAQGNHATQATAGSRPLTTTIGTGFRGIQFDGVDDFLQTAAIDFAGAGISGSNILTGSWTLTVDGGTATATESPAGTLNLTGDGANGANARQAVTTEIGKRYRVDCTVGSSAMSIFIGTTSGGADVFPTTTLNTGVNCVYFTATTTTSHITFRKAGAALSTTSGITVREAIVPADKMTVVAGVRKLSDAANGIVMELTAGITANNGAINLQAPGSIPNFSVNSKGTVQVGTAGGGLAAPQTAVVTGIADISGDALRLRTNGTQVGLDTNDQGTGNFANDIVYIGRRGDATRPLNGVLTFLCVINRTLTAGELAALEAYANSRTGAY